MFQMIIMTKCSTCGQDFDSFDKFCSNCGTLRIDFKKQAQRIQQTKLLKKKIVISFIVVFILDIIGTAIPSQQFNVNLPNISFYQSYAHDFIIVGLIIGILQALIFESQLRFAINSSFSDIKGSYMYIPPVHVLILILIVVFVNVFPFALYLKFLAFIVSNMITGEVIIGLAFFFYRFNKAASQRDTNDESIAPYSDNSGERQRNTERRISQNIAIEQSNIQDSLAKEKTWRFRF